MTCFLLFASLYLYLFNKGTEKAQATPLGVLMKAR